MDKKNVLVIAGVVVAAVVIGAIGFGNSELAQPVNIYIDKVVQGVADTVGGERAGRQEFIDGISPGEATEKWEEVTIGPTANQVAWLNNTGDTVHVKPWDTSVRWESGTASSTWAIYAGTSTTATFTDFQRPTPTSLLIDGSIVATSTASSGGRHNIRVGTTTPSSGVGFEIPNGGYLVFDIQERYNCTATGACETATSSNRGVDNFYGLFKWTKTP